MGLECVCIHTSNLKLIPKERNCGSTLFEFTFVCATHTVRANAHEIDQLTNLEL